MLSRFNYSLLIRFRDYMLYNMNVAIVERNMYPTARGLCYFSSVRGLAVFKINTIHLSIHPWLKQVRNLDYALS